VAALNGTEIAVLALWLVGVVAALFSWPQLTSARHRIGLLVVAVVLPVVGSLVAVTTLAGLSWRGAHRLNDRNLRRPCRPVARGPWPEARGRSVHR